MRNLKRALSLGLTAAMISGLMVMGSSAASYADVTSENNVEAIEVLEAVGIMIGDENGNFNPDQNVTRNEMAVVMANLMEYNVASYKDTSPFTDVPSWAEPYVAACWTNGITAGYSDTIYGGSDTVTTAQAALMLMKALGYFQYASDFGSDWQLATTRQGNAIDLFVGVDSGVTAPMTRNDVAQLVLNTLEAGTVQASTDGSWSIGDVVINNNVRYNYITSNQPYASAIDDSRRTNNDGDLVSGYIVELGEQLYMGDLQLRDNTSDDFERPARTWSYDGAEIGTYMKDELIVATYTTGVSGRELYDKLTGSTVREYAMEVYLDGGDGLFSKDNVTRSNSKDLDGTGDGVLTQVFMNLDTKKITVTSVNTWLAKANSDYNTNSETLSLKVYDEQTDGTDGYTQVIDTEDVAGIEDIVKDQYVLVNMSLKDRNNYEIVAMSDPEILSNANVTKFSTDYDGDKVNIEESLFKSLTANGTSYDSAAKAYYNEDVLNLYDQDLLTDNTYNVYLDPYGYAIGVELYEGTDNYVFIAGYDMNSSNISVRTADAAAIFMDGTMETIKVNVTNTNKNIDLNGDKNYNNDYNKYHGWSAGLTDGEYDHNLWYTYTENNGVYTLRPVGDDNMLVTTYNRYDQTINCSNVWVKDDATDIRGYGNDSSVYITAEPGDVTSHTDGAITDVTGLYTGVQNVEIILENGYRKNVPNDVYTVTDDDQYIVASVVLGEAQGSTANYAFILDPVISEERLEDGTYQWEFKAVMGGTVQTLTARSDYQDVITVLRANDDRVVELRFDGDYVVSAKAVDKDVVTFEQGIDEKNDEVFDVETNVAGVPNMVDLYLSGRTLHTGNRSTGLTFIADAPTVLRQMIRGEWKNVEYSSVQEAYDNLADASTAAGLQFQGRIVAVLNTQGVAEWVYIESLTPAEYDPSNGGGGIIAGDFPVITYDRVNREYEIRYHGNKTPDQEREYVIDVIEQYTGVAVRQYNPLTGELWLENSWTPVQIDPIQVYAVTADGKMQYLDEGTTTITGLTASKNYLYSTTVAALTPDETANGSGYVTVAPLSADLTLVDAYQVNGSGVTLSAGTHTGVSTLYLPYNGKVEATGATQTIAGTYAQFMNGTQALTEPVYVAKDEANVKTITVTGAMNISEVTGTMVEVDGVNMGVYGPSGILIPSNVGGLLFADKSTGTLVTTTNEIGGYRISQATLNGLTPVNGKIQIVQVAAVTATGVTATYKDNNGVAQNAIGANLEIGETITVTATVPASQNIQVVVNGGTPVDLGVEGNGTQQTITYVVKDTDYSVHFQLG